MSLVSLNPAANVASLYNCEATEVQLLKSALAPTSGNLTLSYNGNATANIAFGSVNAAGVQAALRLVAGLGSVVVTGASITAGLEVKFTGVQGDAPLLVVGGTLDNAPTVSTISKGRG